MANIAKVFSYSQGVEERKLELQQIGQQLKNEFVGIDSVIDTIIKLMEPWRIMPEAQNRPVIINLWGMTGTGKTSLVRKISNLLKSQLIQVDLGEFGDNRNFSLDFYDKYADLSDKECIILLDEIQNCKTLDRGQELDRPALRGLWSLLSDGKIIPDKRISKEYYEEDVQDAIEAFIKYEGKVPPKQKISNEAKEVISTAQIPLYDSSGEEEEEQRIPWHISSWSINNILKLCGNRIPYSKTQINARLKTDFLNTAKELLEHLNNLDIQPQLNYQKSIIFIAGNLDEVYLKSKSANPDITPDVLHDSSKKITVPDIKNSLLRRFRPEQVARLGNSHVIYPAFNETNFRSLIQLDLERIKNNTLEQYDVNLVFDQSVEDLIYKEGVFPTQGARPVLSTVSTLVEASLPSCLKEIITQYDKNPLKAPINIKMSLNGNDAKAIFELLDENRELNQEKIFLSIETLRKPIYDEEHVMIAVHEAGHTICQLIEFGELPTKVCAFSPNTNSEGYMERKQKDYITKEMIFSFITVALGGWAAEKYVFGAEKIGIGATGDIAGASSEATACIQRWGFGELPISIQRKTVGEDQGIEYTEETDNQIKKIVEDCLAKAENYIKNNSKLLFDISGELLNKPFLMANDIQEICNRNDFQLHKKKLITQIFEETMEKKNINWKPLYD